MDAEVSELGSGIESADCPVWRTAYQLSVKGEGTHYRYNRDHQLLAIHYPDGGTERFIRDGAGNRIKHILPEQYDPATDDGAGYGYTYDAEDRLTRVTGPSGEVVAAYVYDRMGNCIERKDALGGCHYYAYELRGKRIRELHPLGEGGQPQEARGPQPYQRTDYRYDKNGNRIQEIRYGGSYTKEAALTGRKGPDPDLCL